MIFLSKLKLINSFKKQPSGLIDIYSCETLELIDTIQLKNEDMFEGAQ